MKRHLLRHFVDTNMDPTYETSDYHLLGEGIASLTEEFNPEEETQQWINQESGTSDVKSYTPSIAVEREDVDQEDTKLTEWFERMIDTLPTGKEAYTSYVRVRIRGNGPTYPATMQPCTVQVGSTGGDGGSNVVDSLTLGGRGDKVPGTFNVETGKFTATSTLSAAGKSSIKVDASANGSGEKQ